MGEFNKEWDSIDELLHEIDIFAELDYDGKNVIGDLTKQTLMEVLESPAAKHIKSSFQWFIPPTEFCRECRGGPTFISSALKQASTIAIDIRDRVAPRKNYSKLRKRLGSDELAWIACGVAANSHLSKIEYGCYCLSFDVWSCQPGDDCRKHTIHTVS